MKKIIITTLLIGSLGLSSCSDYLDILPNDKQTTDMFWKSAEDVESILSEAYSSMRTCIPSMITWGEVRGGSILAFSDPKEIMIQDFQILSDNPKVAWADFYKVIGMANSVLKYAPGVMEEDASYKEAQMKSHLTEAYFIRGLMYLYLVRNFKEVPLITEPYVDDEMPNDIAKSSEAAIIEQIKNDVKAALDTNAAKERYEENWANKGRATKWALYALMAETCLWAEDYQGCVEYANLLIHANSGVRPVFISSPSQWFMNFYTQEGYGSNESIFELMFNADLPSGTNGNTPTKHLTFVTDAAPKYLFSEPMTQRIQAECDASSVRSLWGSVALDANNLIATNTNYPQNAAIWKYVGMGVEDIKAGRAGSGNDSDANWIIYRMADVMLMKAEALIRMEGIDNWKEALAIINQIRTRASLPELDITVEETNEYTLLEALLNERDMELAAEGKRWYDLVRLGKQQNFEYKADFISIIVDNNDGANKKWLRSVLNDDNAWYLPIPERDITTNKELVQNPYYDQTKK